MNIATNLVHTREVHIKLPTLHPGQVSCYEDMTRFFAVRCGRRWGKTTMGSTIACDGVISGELIGYFAPDYKRLTEVMMECTEILAPIRKFPSGGKDIIRSITGGRIDFWTLEDESAGRSRKYHKIIIDEAAFRKDGATKLMDIWNKSIKPTLLDYRGSALILSNTNGVDPDQFFWQICNEPQHGFKEYHAPSQQNPLLPRDDLEAWKESMHPMVYAQEILAEFVNWSGQAFLSTDKLLAMGKPVAIPQNVDGVFAVIDTAVKTGKFNDGTGVIYFARSKLRGIPLTILDWDIRQMEGDLLITWLPTVFKRLEELARETKARMGSLGAWIEDKASGMILVQQAKRRGLKAFPIDNALTALGKEERAVNISGYHYNGNIKICEPAFKKVVTYKDASRNHLLSQLDTFRIGDKDPKRQDDLVDCYCYGVALGMGNSQGY